MSARAQGFGQHGGQRLLLNQLLCQGQQRRHIHWIFDGQMAVDGLSQLVLYQAVVEAAVDTRAFVKQLDTVFGVDGGASDYRAPVRHVGQCTQIVRVASDLRAHLEKSVVHARNPNCCLALYETL